MLCRVLDLSNEILSWRISLLWYSRKQFVKREHKDLDFSADGRNWDVSKIIAGYPTNLKYVIYPIICYDLLAESSRNTTILSHS